MCFTRRSDIGIVYNAVKRKLNAKWHQYHNTASHCVHLQYKNTSVPVWLLLKVLQNGEQNLPGRLEERENFTQLFITDGCCDALTDLLQQYAADTMDRLTAGRSYDPTHTVYSAESGVFRNELHGNKRDGVSVWAFYSITEAATTKSSYEDVLQTFRHRGVKAIKTRETSLLWLHLQHVFVILENGKLFKFLKNATLHFP